LYRTGFAILALAGVVVVANACSGRSSSTDDPPAFPDRRPHFDGGGALLGFVANRYSDTISVIDLDTMTELAAVPVGLDPVDIDGPRHVVLDPVKGMAYVALSYPLQVQSPHAVSRSTVVNASYVQALSLAELAPMGELRVDQHPGDLALSPHGELAVSHYDTDLALVMSDNIDDRRANLLVVDPASAIAAPNPSPHWIRVCVAPASVVYGQDGTRAFLACTGEDSLAVVDTVNQKVLSRVPAGMGPVNKPYALTVDSSGTRLLLSNEIAGTVVVFTTDDSPVPVSTATVTGIPFFSGWISDSEFLVPIQNPNGAALIDAKSGSIVQQIAFADGECDNPSEAQATPDGRLFLVCEGDHYGTGSVVRIDPSTLAITARVSVGIYPDRLSILSP
jgi:YVTN family beta-propeller protein